MENAYCEIQINNAQVKKTEILSKQGIKQISGQNNKGLPIFTNLERQNNMIPQKTFCNQNNSLASSITGKNGENIKLNECSEAVPLIAHLNCNTRLAQRSINTKENTNLINIIPNKKT